MYFCFLVYLFIFGHVAVQGSLLLVKAFSSFGKLGLFSIWQCEGFSFCGFSCCRAWASGHRSSGCGSWD